MMRRDFATDSSSSTTELRAIVIAGTLGSGAGLIADVIADVVQLSLGRVERRRKGAAVGRRALAIERLDIDPLAADRLGTDAAGPAVAGLAIMCDADADAAVCAEMLQADERILVDDSVPDGGLVEEGVPAWRQNLLPGSGIAGSGIAGSDIPGNGIPGNGVAEKRDAPARRRSIDVTARGVAIVSRRLPYDRELWRRSLARHVPKRFRDAALARFDAETGE